MHSTPNSETHTGSTHDGDVNVVASLSQHPTSRNRNLTLELPLIARSDVHDVAPDPSGVCDTHAREPETSDLPAMGLQRICVLLAEGFLAQKIAESRVHEFPRAIAQVTPKSRAGNNTSASDSLIVEEVTRCGSASPRHLGLILRINRTPLQKALRRLEAVGALVGVGKTRNRVYRRIVKPVETAAA